MSEKTKKVAISIFSLILVLIVILYIVSDNEKEVEKSINTITYNASETFDVLFEIGMNQNDGRPIFEVSTNLPNGMTILGSVYNENDELQGQFSSEIKNGIVVFGPYSNKGNPYYNGDYKISFSSSLWRLQPQEVQNIDQGIDLEGECISHDKLVDCKGNFTISQGIPDELVERVINLNHAALVTNFCYALQASSIADDLKMRVDTENKIETIVGGKIRGPKSPYNTYCGKGLDQVFAEDKNKLSAIAWKKFGCDGTVEPRLIQQNPFTNPNARLCEF